MLVSAADSSGDCRARAPSAQWCRSGGVRPTPGDTGSTYPDFVLIRCLDDGQGLLAVTGWAAEDDEAIAGDRPGNQRQKCHTRLWSTGSTSPSGDSWPAPNCELTGQHALVFRCTRSSDT
jgi:hypothetical protein